MGLSRDVLRVFYVILLSLASATHLFSHWKPLGFKVWKDSQCLSFSNAFFENMYTLNVKLKFLPNKEMFDHCLKLKFKSRTQVVWRNASSEYWTSLLRCFWPMQLIAPIVKFLLLISKKKNLFDYFCFSCVFKI